MLKKLISKIFLGILLISGSTLVFASISMFNYTNSSIITETGMEIFKYESETMDMLTDQADFNSQTITQDQFQPSTPDLEAISDIDDYLTLNHYGDNPPDTSEVDWWDDDSDSSTKYNWRYRKCFSVDLTDPSATDLIEYQLYLDFDTQTLISQNKMLADGSDIRFTNASGVPVDHYIADDINTDTTRIWIQPDLIPAGQISEFCMYYGYVPYIENPILINLPLTTSDTESVFSYSTLRQIYYAVSNRVNNSITNFASYFDGTQIVIDTYNEILNQYEFDSYPQNTTLDENTFIQTTAPIGSVYQNDPTDTLVPAAAAGTEFVYYMDRNTNEFSFISPYCDTNLEVRNNLNNLLAGGTFTVTQGDAVDFLTNNNASDGLPNDSTVIIESTNSCPFYVYHHTDNGQDVFPMWPASNEWYGVGSSQAHIGALADTTNVDIFRSDGSTSSLILNRGGNTTFAGGSQGNTFSHRVVADKPIGVNQVADGDGTDAATFMPILEMGYKYLIPEFAEYVSVSTLEGESGDIDFYDDASLCEVGVPDQTITITGTNNLPGFARFTSLSSASCLVSEIPMAVYYEEDASDDEKNVWSEKQNRQYVDGYPSDVQSSSEEGIWTLGSTTQDWTRRIQVSITNNSSSTIEEFQYPIDISSTNIFSLAQPDGGDIRIAGINGDGTDDENYFLDLYSTSDSRGIVWVQIDSLAPASSKDYYIYYRSIDTFDTLSLNPSLWLDGNDIDGDGLSGNNPTGNLATWEDLSGNNNDATQTAPADQPLINNNFVEFRGEADNNTVGEFMDLPSISAQTFFAIIDNANNGPSDGINSIVGQPLSGGIYTYLFANTEPSRPYVMSFDGNGSETGTYSLDNTALVGPGENIGTGVFPSTQTLLYATYTNPQSNWYELGSLTNSGTPHEYRANYDMKEFVAIPNTVTALDRTNFSEYLIKKWDSTQSITTLSTTGSIDDIFQTTTPRTSYYVVDSQNVTGNLSIFSFEDGNEVSNGIDSEFLDQGEFITYPFNTGIDQSDSFFTNKPLSINFTDDDTDAPVPVGWMGTEFVYDANRNNDSFSFRSIYQDATVEIYESSSGAWVLDQTISLTANVVQNVVNDINNAGGYKIISDQPILATQYTDGGDSKVLYPSDQAFEESTNEYVLYGVSSNNLLLAASNDVPTNVTIYRDDGTFTPLILNAGNNYVYQETGTAQGTGTGLRIVADGPIGATSLADADGLETVVFLPKKEFSDLYVFPDNTQYVSITTDDPSVTCRIFDDTGVEVTTGPPEQNNLSPQTSGILTSPFPNHIHIGGSDTSDGAFFFEGYTLRCDEPVYAYFEHHLNSLISDETTLLSYPQVRQRAEFEPVIEDPDNAPEQGLYFESGFDSNTTATYPEAQLEWILDTSSLTNSEHTFWNQIDWTELTSDRTNENGVNAIEVEVAYADPSPTCALATYTSLTSTETTISTSGDPSPPFSIEVTDINQIQIPDEASDSECLKVTITFRTGDEAYSPQLPEISVKYRLPNLLEDQLNTPIISINGSLTDDRVRILKITNPNLGLLNSTCQLTYNSVSNAGTFTNADFELYESVANSLNPQFDFPAFPATPPTIQSGSSSVCDSNNDLSVYLDHARSVGVTESIDMTLEQDIQNLNGPLSTRDFSVQITSP